VSSINHHFCATRSN